MKKLYSLLLSILSFIVSNAQTFEEKISEKSCECIKNLKERNNENNRNCISIAMSEITIDDDSFLKTISTVEGVNSTFKKVDSILKKTCNVIINSIENKKEKFYSDSKNETAYSFFLTSTDMLQQENYDIAIEGFLIAIDLDKNYVKAYDHLAICYRKKNQLDKAIKYYKKSLEIFPEGDLALMNIGVIYRIMEDYKESIKYYSKLVDYYPNNAEGYFGLSQNYLMLNDEEKALDNIFKAYKIYTIQDSHYKKDAELIINIIQEILKSRNQENIFKKIADENNIII